YAFLLPGPFQWKGLFFAALRRRNWSPPKPLPRIGETSNSGSAQAPAARRPNPRLTTLDPARNPLPRSVRGLIQETPTADQLDSSRVVSVMLGLHHHRPLHIHFAVQMDHGGGTADDVGRAIGLV